MKRREGRRPQSADLLVCFPSRAHLALMPKPICSPARPREPSKRHQSRHPNQQHHHLIRKSSTRLGAGQASPLLWSKSKQVGSDISEPTSPKVTCAGQIKVRHKNTPCKSWQSVMEEIERIHNEREQKKRSTWMESIGFKKEVMQFLTCLRSIRFDFRCFGSFPQSDITTEDDDEDDEEEDEEKLQGSHVGGEGSDGNEAASRTVFSRWFMVLQENQNCGFCREEKKETQRAYDDESHTAAPSVPPPNALLLMRCRSAPAKTWLEERDDDDEEDEKQEENKDDEEEENGKKEEKKGKNLKTLIEEEKRNDKKESFLVMRHDSDFYKISSDIAKETWVVGGMTSEPLSRSRSWKR